MNTQQQLVTGVPQAPSLARMAYPPMPLPVLSPYIPVANQAQPLCMFQYAPQASRIPQNTPCANEALAVAGQPVQKAYPVPLTGTPSYVPTKQLPYGLHNGTASATPLANNNNNNNNSHVVNPPDAPSTPPAAIPVKTVDMWRRAQPLKPKPEIIGKNAFVDEKKPVQKGPDVTPLRATPTTPVSGLAGAIAKRIREIMMAEVLSQGSESINQAMKALALARSFLLEEDLCILVQPEITDDDEGERHSIDNPNVVLKFIAQGWEAKEPPHPHLDVAIRVCARSVVRKTAGAIAKLMRSRGATGQAVGVLTMGAEAVSITARALSIARTMLEQDGTDIHFRPQFITVEDEVSNDLKPALQLSLFLVRR